MGRGDIISCRANGQESNRRDGDALAELGRLWSAWSSSLVRDLVFCLFILFSFLFFFYLLISFTYSITPQFIHPFISSTYIFSIYYLLIFILLFNSSVSRSLFTFLGIVFYLPSLLHSPIPTPLFIHSHSPPTYSSVITFSLYIQLYFYHLLFYSSIYSISFSLSQLRLSSPLSSLYSLTSSSSCTPTHHLPIHPSSLPSLISSNRCLAYIFPHVSLTLVLSHTVPSLPFIRPSIRQVTKLLGAEWSAMSVEQKAAFVSRSEQDKRRYRNELQAYRQSHDYQLLLRKKRIKSMQGVGGTEGVVGGRVM